MILKIIYVVLIMFSSFMFGYVTGILKKERDWAKGIFRIKVDESDEDDDGAFDIIGK